MFRRCRSWCLPYHRMSSPGLTRRSILCGRVLYRWMRGSSPRMTSCVWETITSPAEPFRLARQLDRLDLLELDRALGHQIVDVAVGRARDLRAIEVDLHGTAMVLVGPGRGVADAFHAGGHPV